LVQTHQDAPLSGSKSAVDGLLWEQEVGGSIPLSPTIF